MDIGVAWSVESPTWRTPDVSNARAMASAIGAYAYLALIKEVELTPKPGLVDRFNTGAHKDMDISTFRASAGAIAPWFPAFFRRGLAEYDLPARDFLPMLRVDGLACERDMFRATSGINTHKGSIFALGLLCAAAGRLCGARRRIDYQSLCLEVAAMSAMLIEQELGSTHEARTAGELLFQRHGLTGARGEAASGFATVCQHGLAPYWTARAQGCDEREALHEVLIHLMAYNQDTNLVARGGMEGLAYVQSYARGLLAEKPRTTEDRISQLSCFDNELISRNLSPGGSADLLSVTWFLSNFYI
ncbi:MAG: triphosphoribosyl-dephospho-CoA synthase CitG [Formivibrio sp.]|nr:triphosphoribosyl-dephospho-CoA synthase CitG [Formivibrio sp.]